MSGACNVPGAPVLELPARGPDDRDLCRSTDLSGSALPQATSAVPCRCCPGGISRSARVPRYPSDMSDAEWQVIEPTLPVPAWKGGKGGRPAERCRRDIVDAIRYLVKEGIQWRAMPVDFPPFGPSMTCWMPGRSPGRPKGCTMSCARQCRIAAGRKPEPTAAIIDSQSVKAAETVGRTSRGYDAGKKINGRKRHIAVDTIGLLLTVLGHRRRRPGPRRR